MNPQIRMQSVHDDHSRLFRPQVSSGGTCPSSAYQPLIGILAGYQGSFAMALQAEYNFRIPTCNLGLEVHDQGH